MAKPNPVIDRIRSHFEDQARKEILVPEWDLSVFCSPLTVSERSAIFKAGQSGDLEYQVEAILIKACDADGKKLFTAHDRVHLMHHADPGVVELLAARILGPDIDENPNKEVEAVKKS